MVCRRMISDPHFDASFLFDIHPHADLLSQQHHNAPSSYPQAPPSHHLSKRRSYGIAFVASLAAPPS